MGGLSWGAKRDASNKSSRSNKSGGSRSNSKGAKSKTKAMRRITSMRFKNQISEEQIYQIYGTFRRPIFEFFEKLIPEKAIEFDFSITKQNF